MSAAPLHNFCGLVHISEKIFPALGTRFISVKENFDNFTCGNAMESLPVSLQMATDIVSTLR
ncbi:MAG: hypothetical protein K2L38_04020 [Dysosmobacter sp.]|nr:hypothetical protein [Dysosmobacter sp.]